MKTVVANLLDYGCTALRHVGTCGLVNDAFRIRYDEGRDDWRWTVTNPLFRLWLWANDIDLGIGLSA